MAALHSTPNRTLDNRVVLRLPRGRVLVVSPGRVAVVHIVAADELLSVISAKEVWPHQCERSLASPCRLMARYFWTYAVVSDFPLIPYGRIHLKALSTNMIRYTDPPRDVS